VKVSGHAKRNNIVSRGDKSMVGRICGSHGSGYRNLQALSIAEFDEKMTSGEKVQLAFEAQKYTQHWHNSQVHQLV
jgi:hypothetical protein